MIVKSRDSNPKIRNFALYLKLSFRVHIITNSKTSATPTLVQETPNILKRRRYQNKEKKEEETKKNNSLIFYSLNTDLYYIQHNF